MPSLFSLDVPLILASQSPRRRELLEQIGVSFTVQVSPARETTEEELPPKDRARAYAAIKAKPVAEAHPSSLVLAADTIVVHGDTVLEKPESTYEARQMLYTLSDTTHSVYTALCLHHASSDRVQTVGSETRVEFAALDDAEIEAYVDSGSPMDKAGGYGIQDHTGPLLVDQLEGDYYTVVGLPLRLLYVTLRRHFSDLVSGPGV